MLGQHLRHLVVRLLLVSVPTAKQLLADGQETPRRAGPVALPGLGVAWIAHVLAALADPAAHTVQAAAAIRTVKLRRMILLILPYVCPRTRVSAAPLHAGRAPYGG